MPPAKISLNVHVPWHHVLRVLGVPARSPALPTTATCPLCKQPRLLIFPNSTRRGQWHYCRNCQHHGDMIELAAATWKISESSALLKLSASGLNIPLEALQPDAINNYLHHYIHYRQRIEDTWAAAQKNLFTNQRSTGTLLSKLGISSTDPPDRRRAGAAQMYGATDRDTIEKMAMPGAFGMDALNDASRNPRSASADRVFRGARWGPVIAFPFYDLPGSIRSFLFVGRNCEEGDYVYRRFSSYAPDTRAEADFGLALHPQLHTVLADWDNRVYAMNDAVLAAKLQVKQYHTSTRPLPVVAWHDSPAGRSARGSWLQLGSAQVIFWCETIDAKLMRQVLTTDGLISLIPRERKGARYWFADKQPDEVLKWMAAQARPWPEVLSDEILAQPEHWIEELCLQLQLCTDSFPEVLQQLTPAARQRAQAVLRQNLPLNSRVVDRHTVVETAEGWMLEKAGKQQEIISDAILRIDEIVYQPRQRQTYYRGRILYRGEEIPFCQLRETVERHPARWLQDTLIKAGKGFLQYSPLWANKLPALAAQFHQATVSTHAASVGWDTEKSRFVLADYVIELGGQTAAHTGVLSTADSTPGKFPLPEILSPAELAVVTQVDPATSLFWALQICTLANILAPVFHRPTSGVAVVDPPQPLGSTPWALDLGSPVCHLDGPRAIPVALEAEQAHGWPISVGYQPGQVALQCRWLMADAPIRNHVMGVRLPLAVRLSVHGGWHVVQAYSQTGQNGYQTLFPVSIIPAYLQDLATRQLELNEQDCWLDTIAQDLRQWLQPLVDDTACVAAGRDLILADREPGHIQIVGRLVAQAALEGDVALVPINIQENPRKRLFYCETRQAVFLPHQLLAGLLPVNGLSCDPAKVTAAFWHAGVLLGEEEVRGAAGWWLKYTWWQKQLQAAKPAAGLRLANGT